MEVACYNIYRKIIVEKKIIFLFHLIWLIIKYGCFRCDLIYSILIGEYLPTVRLALVKLYFFRRQVNHENYKQRKRRTLQLERSM